MSRRCKDLAPYYPTMEQELAYHHGDLRRALIAAAREMIEADGVGQLSLRKVARSANVSHAAPYHHFKDKEALLAAVAEEGFVDLRAAVLRSTKGLPNPSAAFQEAAIAYVVFAVRHEKLFRVMFGPQLALKSEHPSLETAAAAAFEMIEAGHRRLGSSGDVPDQRSKTLSIASWAVVHGLAVLLIDNQVGQAKVEDIAREVTGIFWVGLSQCVTAGGPPPAP